MSIVRIVEFYPGIPAARLTATLLEIMLKEQVGTAIKEGLRYGKVRVTIEREDIEVIEDSEGNSRVSELSDEREVSGQ